MSLAEAVEADRRKPRPCVVGQFLAAQDDGYRSEFEGEVAKADDQVPGHNFKRLWRAMVTTGLDCTYTTLTRHTKAECGCYG